MVQKASTPPAAHNAPAISTARWNPADSNAGSEYAAGVMPASPGSTATAYRFSGAAGDHIVIEPLSVDGDITSRVIDPYGVQWGVDQPVAE